MVSKSMMSPLFESAVIQKKKKSAKMHKIKIVTSTFLLCCAGNRPFITRIRDCSGHSGTVMWSVIKMQNADVPATLALEAARVNIQRTVAAYVDSGVWTSRMKCVFIIPLSEFY